MQQAVYDGDLDKVKEYIDQGVDVNQSTTISPLMMATTRGYLEIAELLIKHGANVNYVNSSDQNTPLIKAAERGHLDIIKLLLKNGANFRMENCLGRTAVEEAVAFDQISAAKLIVESL